MTLQIIGGLVFLFLAIRLYRFNQYIKRYLVAYDIKILTNEKKEDLYYLNFTVVFGKGYFNKKYFTAIGNLRSKKRFSDEMLRQMLSLTEIKNLYGKTSQSEIEYKYTYFQSLKEASDKNSSGEYLVYYTIVDQAALDFVDSQLDELKKDGAKYYDGGVAKFKKGDYKGAVDSLSKAIELNRNNGDIYFDRAGAKKKLGDNRGAIQDYTKAIELNPSDADAYCGRAYSKGSLEDYQGAVTDALRAIEIKPDHVDALKLVQFFQKKS